MALSINTNMAALNAYRNLSSTQNDMNSSLEKLSSGYRINRAADDAAGLAISEGLRSQIGGLKVAVRNAQDGISVVQTAEGALTETHDILQRMRDLSVQASNQGGLSTDAKANIQSEMDQLKDELTRIADTTSFNGTSLLDGSYSGKFQVGANSGETISVAIGTAMSAAGLGVSAIDVTAAAGASATNSVWTSTSDFSGAAIAAGVTVDVQVNGQTVTLDGGAAGIDENGIASQITAAGVGVTAAMNGTALELTSSTTGPNSISVSGFNAIVAGTDTGALVSGTNGSLSGAEAAIDTIDAAIATVSTTRADLGAVQNRFDHTINNLNVAVENLTASESRIRDTDMASEMVNFTRSQILSQAGTAMLAQAKSIPQGVLQLLQYVPDAAP